mgnify:CR=1 FL=1
MIPLFSLSFLGWLFLGLFVFLILIIAGWVIFEMLDLLGYIKKSFEYDLKRHRKKERDNDSEL